MNETGSLQTELRTRPVVHPDDTRPPEPDNQNRARPYLLMLNAWAHSRNALTARIAAAKRRLLAGGMLQEVEWGIPGVPDMRGRRIFTYFDARSPH